MYRKRLTSAVLIFLLLACCSCSEIVSNSGTSDRSDSVQNENHFLSRFTTTEDAVFFMSGMDGNQPNCLIYADKASGNSGPLCGKPECKHSGKGCNAYFSSGDVYALSKYGENKLILVCESGNVKKPSDLAVFSINADGTGRNQLRDISDPWEGAGHLNTWALIYRDYIFIGGLRQTIEEGSMENIAFVNAYPINSDKVFNIYEGKANSAPNGRIILLASGNCLYYLDSEYMETDSSENNGYQLSIGEWNLKTKTGREIYMGEFPYWVWDTGIENDEIFMSGLGSSEIYKISVSEGTIEKAFDYPNTAGVTITFTSEGAIDYSYPEMPDYSKRQVTISDFFGNELHRYVEMEDLTTDEGFVFNRTYCGSDAECLYFYFAGETAEGTQKRLFRSVSIETGEMKTLWEEEIPTVKGG